jgi:hypothetical protein
MRNERRQKANDDDGNQRGNLLHGALTSLSSRRDDPSGSEILPLRLQEAAWHGGAHLGEPANPQGAEALAHGTESLLS